MNNGGWHKVRVQFSPSYMSLQELYGQIVLEQNFPSNLNVFFDNSNSIFDLFQCNGVIKLWSDVEVNDGGWHEVRAQFNPSYMGVTVDGRKKSHRPELLDNRHIDLSGLLYFGGIEAIKRSRAVSQGFCELLSGFE